MNTEERERIIQKVVDDFSSERDLSSLLLDDFMIHLGTNTTLMLLKHMIESAKTPEEKEALRAVPRSIIESWEKSRIQELGNSEEYAKWFSDKGFTLEDTQEISKRFAASDARIVAQVADRLREGFKAIEEAL